MLKKRVLNVWRNCLDDPDKTKSMRYQKRFLSLVFRDIFILHLMTLIIRKG